MFPLLSMSNDGDAAESIGSFNVSDFLCQPLDTLNGVTEFPISSYHNDDAESHRGPEVFSDMVLEHINQMLMEDMDDKYDMLQTHPDLEATEKPFYELLGEKYPPSTDRRPLYSSFNSKRSDFNQSQIVSPHSKLFFEILPSSQFEKGVEEANKFLPSADRLVINFGEVDLTIQSEQSGRHVKNRHGDELDSFESRISKQLAVTYEEPSVPVETFDDVLLSIGQKFPKVVISIRKKIYSEASHFNNPCSKSRRKKQLEEEMVDLNTLLRHCAQSVTSGDNQIAYDLLRKIRQHSSPYGNASQRIAHYAINGLEARLAGTGSEVFRSLAPKRKTVVDVLKAYQLYLASSPFKRFSYHFANRNILDVTQNATRIHILDFGIHFGFQWPVFIKMLSCRPGGPPKLRITGIDNPQPGFRPTERIEETGRRLADYARRFGVPFEYDGIAAKLDDVNLEEINLHDGEMLVVNSLFRMHNLADETLVVDCPRDEMLKAIRKLNPAVFVNVVINGSYGAPFFLTRFREALYHFSAVFDMLDTTVPRENEQRQLVERDMYGRFLINAISCEGFERERPETYKQWQVRCLRAGFEQIPVCPKFLKSMKHRVRAYYHKDFNIDEDGRWVLEGWKGRILFALSAWKPRQL